MPLTEAFVIALERQSRSISREQASWQPAQLGSMENTQPWPGRQRHTAGLIQQLQVGIDPR